MAKLPVCKRKVAVRAFEKHGWSLARYIDDHFILKKSGERFLLSVPDHNPVKNCRFYFAASSEMFVQDIGVFILDKKGRKSNQPAERGERDRQDSQDI